ncbi:MAG TPA: kelch repeat-containing protein [Rubricoccaceae bacterium]|nr:kelch repeat-containing protein [Rubricoccaceae bacterium]
MPTIPPAGPRAPLVLILALAAAGCERPFVAPDPVVLSETSPDLSVVQTAEALPLRLRVSDAAGVERVMVNGEAASPSPEPGVFLDTLRLRLGLNPLFVAVLDDEGNVAEDTLYAAYLPYETALAGPLPERRYGHTATALADGSVLIAGGFDETGAAGSALLAREAVGLVTYTPLPDSLHRPRGGHTATRLPDGRVLFLGGAGDAAGGPSQFVAEAEVYDPATRTFTVVPVEGEPPRRYAHAALALESGGRVFVYVYGGLEAHAGGTTPTGTLVVLELREEDGADVLTVISPPGGIGALPPTYGHALLPLPPAGDLQRALALGADLGAAEPLPFALRLTFHPSTAFFPFEIETEAIAPPDTALAAFGATEVLPGLVVLSGGQAPPFTPAPPLDELRLYAAGAGRIFTFPEHVRLRIPRSRHTATLLPSGRILLVGGVGTDTGALDQTELIGPN